MEWCLCAVERGLVNIPSYDRKNENIGGWFSINNELKISIFYIRSKCVVFKRLHLQNCRRRLFGWEAERVVMILTSFTFKKESAFHRMRFVTLSVFSIKHLKHPMMVKRYYARSNRIQLHFELDRELPTRVHNRKTISKSHANIKISCGFLKALCVFCVLFDPPFRVDHFMVK